MRRKNLLRNRFWLVFAGITLAAFAMPSCVGAARTFDAYEADAVATAKEVSSAAATAKLAIETSQDGKLTANYLSVLLVEAENTGSSAQSQFDSVQPPGAEADQLSAALAPLLQKTNDILTELRVTVRRSELEQLPRLAAPLSGLLDKLDKFALEHER